MAVEGSVDISANEEVNWWVHHTETFTANGSIYELRFSHAISLFNDVYDIKIGCPEYLKRKFPGLNNRGQPPDINRFLLTFPV